MAGTFSASVKGWSEKAKRNLDLVVKGSAQDVTELMSRRVQGVSVGGTFVEGFVPVGKTSGLINSLGFALNALPQAGGGDYLATLVGMELGDTFTATFSIEYARSIEYGWTTKSGSRVPGRFMVRGAVQQWQTIVSANAAQFQD